MIHMCADMCAAEHARPYITCRATSTAVCLLVVIRTRSRTGGARGGEGRPYFVYARCYRKEGRGPLHPVHHAAYSSFSLPQLEYDGGGHKKKTNIGLLLFRFVPVSSCRTKGPFEILNVFNNRTIEFRHEPSGITTVVVPHTTFNDIYLVGSYQLELLGTCWYLVHTI